MKIAVAGATGRLGRHVAEVLTERGHQVVAMSRATGVDIITGSGLEAALDGAEVIVDAATSPSPEQEAATEFFLTAAHNLQQAGVRAGVRRAVVVSIINIDKFTGGYGVAKIAHEDAWRSGPIPAQIVRAAQFHEFVAQLLEWGTRGDVATVPEMRTKSSPRSRGHRRVIARAQRSLGRTGQSRARDRHHRTPAAVPLACAPACPACPGPPQQVVTGGCWSAEMLIMKQPDGGASLKWVALPREVSVIRAGDQELGGGRGVFCWHATYR